MVKKIKLLITGSDGQLGRVFFKLSKHFPQYDFVFYSKKTGAFKVIKVGKNNYSRLTVPPKIWFGFKGMSKPESIILNITNVGHNPKEILRCKKNDINFNW